MDIKPTLCGKNKIALCTWIIFHCMFSLLVKYYFLSRWKRFITLRTLNILGFFHMFFQINLWNEFLLTNGIFYRALLILISGTLCWNWQSFLLQISLNMGAVSCLNIHSNSSSGKVFQVVEIMAESYFVIFMNFLVLPKFHFKWNSWLLESFRAIHIYIW